jgi:hypothetical protein
MRDLLSPSKVAALTADDLWEFGFQLKVAPPYTIPSACAADLIATTDAIKVEMQLAQP